MVFIASSVLTAPPATWHPGDWCYAVRDGQLRPQAKLPDLPRLLHAPEHLHARCGHRRELRRRRVRMGHAAMLTTNYMRPSALDQYPPLQAWRVLALVACQECRCQYG